MKREIDKQTIIELLLMLSEHCKRINFLVENGIDINVGNVEAIYDFVLDALGVPSHRQHNEETNLYYSRHPLYELFYSDYLLDDKLIIENIPKKIREEIEEHWCEKADIQQ